MRRALLALLLSAVVLASPVEAVSARPAGPETCTFELGFAAFRDARGEEIVGDCESDQASVPVARYPREQLPGQWRRKVLGIEALVLGGQHELVRRPAGAQELAD